ncbi:cell wall-binding repeat-containing protein [Nostocoides sp. F2B08]|uniref:cell wall-binding repeat-containing protein n=1 Tax=Nostocoides sp. F2B08 TaxID=2653936 RepID=UPI00186AFE8B|nr:cell wall-binding repeat-containing protein [Tetrasphaera sp. F2B08]
MGSFVTRSLVALGAGAALVLVPASTAYAEPAPNPLVPGDDEQAILTLPDLPEYDSQFNWSRWVEEIDYDGGECLKTTVGGQTFTMPAFPGQFEDWLVTIVKSVGDESTPATNDLTWWPIPGEVFWHSSGQDIAHVIYCSADFSDDGGVVPPPPVTTTTTPTPTPTNTTTTPPVTATVERLWGQTAYETAVAISENAFPSGADTVFVATGETFPDALAAAPAATLSNAPVLLVRRDSVPAATQQELLRLAPQNIVLLGGTLAVSEAVEESLRGFTTQQTPESVTRIWGATRYDTAAAISGGAFQTDVPVVYVATGQNFADALAGGAVAARDGAPVILVGPTGIPPGSHDELTRLSPTRIVLLGGPLAVDESVATLLAGYTDGGTGSSVQRVWGQNAYETAVEVSTYAYPTGAATVYLATGGKFPDALAVAPVAGQNGAPVLLLPPDGTVPASVAAEITRLNPQRVVVLGGELAITAGQYDAVAALLAP